LPLTVYVPSTVYNTRFNTVYEVSKLRIVSNYATQLDIEYYDPDTNSIYTRISVPTRILRGVSTEFLGFSRTPATAGQAQAAQPTARTTQPRATKVPV
jgi:hypothetical protein